MGRVGLIGRRPSPLGRSPDGCYGLVWVMVLLRVPGWWGPLLTLCWRGVCPVSLARTRTHTLHGLSPHPHRTLPVLDCSASAAVLALSSLHLLLPHLRAFPRLPPLSPMWSATRQVITHLRRAPHAYSRRCWCLARGCPPGCPPPPPLLLQWVAAPPPPPARPAARATPASPVPRRRRCRRGCSSTGLGAGKRSSARTQTFTQSARPCASRCVGEGRGASGQAGGVLRAVRGNRCREVPRLASSWSAPVACMTLRLRLGGCAELPVWAAAGFCTGCGLTRTVEWPAPVCVLLDTDLSFCRRPSPPPRPLSGAGGPSPVLAPSGQVAEPYQGAPSAGAFRFLGPQRRLLWWGWWRRRRWLGRPPVRNVVSSWR